jgi:hypothetical protein
VVDIRATGVAGICIARLEMKAGAKPGILSQSFDGVAEDTWAARRGAIDARRLMRTGHTTHPGRGDTVTITIGILGKQQIGECFYVETVGAT